MAMISNYKLLFWDFDGVIKESIEIKTRAFVKLFEPFGRQIANRVRDHHTRNGGMSRFEKMPIYLRWAGTEPNREKVEEYCERFSQLAFMGVIEAAWVPGAENYLRENPHRQIFVLVSATPHEEIMQILQAVDLLQCFRDVYGAPTTKTESIRKTLLAYTMKPEDCLVIGDAKADFDAAQANKVPFLLRRHESNKQVFLHYHGEALEDFRDL